MPDETGFGGAEDLVALLKQKQMQKPQQNLEGFLGGEREGTATAQNEQIIPMELVKQFSDESRTDAERLKIAAQVMRILPHTFLTGTKQLDNILDNMDKKQFSQGGGADLMRKEHMNQLGFE